MKTKNRSGTNPKLAVGRNGAANLMVKQGQKRHYKPLTPEQQAKYLSQGQDVSEVLPDIDVVEIGNEQTKAVQKFIKKTDLPDHHQATSTILSAPNIFPTPCVGWQALLICLMALFMDLAVPHLSGVPIVLLGLLTAIPDGLRTILSCVHGSDILKESGAKLKRPCCLTAVVPLGAATPSLNPEDYLGGYVRVWHQKKFLWLPYRCTAFAVSANVPRLVSKAIVSFSSLAVPFLCEAKNPFPDRPALNLDSEALQSYDPDMLSALEKQSALIHAQLSVFSIWLRKKGKRWNQCVQNIETFRPMVRSGRFVTPVMSADANFFSVALALLKHFLLFAEKQEWLSSGEAQAFLMAAWKEVLPESCPSLHNSGTEKLNGTWDSPAIFWDFLETYLDARQREISLSGAPCPYGTPAVFHQLPDGGRYLIVPRDRLTNEYAEFLSGQDIPLPNSKKREVNLQRTILKWGVPVKTEGEDISWRFPYYDPETVPMGQKSKLPCLAFPVNMLPDNIQEWMKNTFGDVFGQADQKNVPDVAPEKEMEVK